MALQTHLLTVFTKDWINYVISLSVFSFTTNNNLFLNVCFTFALPQRLAVGEIERNLHLLLIAPVTLKQTSLKNFKSCLQIVVYSFIEYTVKQLETETREINGTVLQVTLWSGENFLLASSDQYHHPTLVRRNGIVILDHHGNSSSVN